MRIYLSSIAPQVITDLNFIRPDLRLNVLQPFVFRNNQGIDADIWRSLKQITNRGFKFKVQHPVLGYWRLLKKLHRVS